ncbi:MerR family transcriptional regulator [Tsukamurella sp. 8F]|uniref:MerR family transcriptional regulator n=1 Tax=unclassified Tsukamurella TaxID=2633480 RepID=UPI0023B9B2C8|nr:MULTISPECIES: MerR family transcriptional regulator [unclassified Tsukamurella]MDF0528836.1 MerR family transcriptional regulator [Tsukamurella sp. 8J]MDF0586671.1 MerR family transcriptional regulator [Tsukamurella sp. 8F]
MTDSPRLLTIGEFSSLTRISVRMLRYYDTHAVLSPARVDGDTGYRWYSADQVAAAGIIRRLRDVGFGVSAIGAVLALRGTPDYLHALRAQRTVLEEQAEAAHRRLAALDRMLEAKETSMSDTTVAVVDLPAQTVAYLRDTIPDYAAEGALWERLLPALQAQGIAPSGGGGTIEHDGEFRESDVDESVFLVVPPGTAVDAPLCTVDLPARTAVVATVTGPYQDAIPRAHEAISAYLAEYGLTPTRSADDIATHHFNVYISTPMDTPEELLETSVHVPVG